MKNFLITFLFLIFTMNNILLAEEFTEYTKANAEKCDQGDCENGQGSLIWSDGTSYVGEFKDNKINGQGIFIWSDGLKYEGELKDNLLHGQGTLTFPDGSTYVGEFKDDLGNGQGTLTAADGTLIFKGEVKDDLYHGQGTLIDDGNKYVGEFKEDKFSGQGTLTYANGDKVEGAFKDNKINGYGKYTYANGNKIVGRWEDGNQVEGETNFIETSENKAKRDTSNDDLYLYDKNEKYFEIYEEDSENKKKAKNAFNAAARCYNSLSLIDRKKTNMAIRYSRQELGKAMTFERSENLFGGGDEKVSERAYNHAKTIADRFVGQNCL